MLSQNIIFSSLALRLLLGLSGRLSSFEINLVFCAVVSTVSRRAIVSAPLRSFLLLPLRRFTARFHSVVAHSGRFLLCLRWAGYQLFKISPRRKSLQGTFEVALA